MSKRVFIVHGWQGFPEEGWFPWLRAELESHGFEVHVPAMPDSNHPRIETWVPHLQKIVDSPDEDTYFVGHSMGCQGIARYLETLPPGTTVGGAVFVAGFFTSLTGFDDDPDVQETDCHWLEAPIDLEKIHSHLPRSTAIFSDNDPCVPLENKEKFQRELGSDIIILENMLHFSGCDGVTKLPEARDALLSMTMKK